jgi:beta-galactosidase
MMPCRYSRVLSAVIGLLAAFYWPVPVSASSADVAQEAGARATSPGDGITRALMDLSHGWRFRQDAGLSGVESSAFDDSQWTAVELPHTWNRIGNEGTERSPLTNDVQGVGWYRLRFKVPPTSTTRHYFLQFDGVGAIADVWLNGHYLGKHAGAFSRFRFDASAAIKASGENLLVVKADNSRPQPGSATENVIPLSGDFFVFGGIYRSVTLIVTDPVHADMLDYGGPGLYARAVTIDSRSAAVRVSAKLVNDGSTPRTVIVETRIESEPKVIVASESSRVSIPPTQPMSVEHTLHVERPRLWQGVKDPYLYKLLMTVRSTQGLDLDQVAQPLGLRSLKFDSDKGFFLNGEHLFLKGASMHQDRPAKGWAISQADQAQDFDLLRDMGGNAVRLAHYQHDQYSYELADALGFVVWAEIPLVNKVSFDGSFASPELAANARQQLTELIRQNYNHPSIAVWSIANEIDLTATQIKGPSKPATLLKSLDLLAKQEDLSRFTTFADCCEVSIAPHADAVGTAIASIAPRDAIVGIADTVGYNRYFGWYTGQFDDFGAMLDEAHKRHPALPIAVSEYGAGAALTQHTDDPAGGPINPHGRPHPEEFQNWYHEASWNALRGRAFVWGAFIWNMFDFSSDSRSEGDLTDINEKGLVSYDRRIRKDAFYFYRANWSGQPTLHLIGRRYVDRPYGVVDVKAYSNAAQVRLWVNDGDQGMTLCEGGICMWRSVHLRPGPNILRAAADVRGATLFDSMQWTFSGSLDSVQIKAGDISGYVSKAGQRYGSDTYFSGGAPRGINAPDSPASGRIAVAADDAGIYDSFREGEFSYRVPVPSGRYRVILKFQEPAAGAAGEREFDVQVNGKIVLRRFDIFAAAGGKLKAVDRSFDATSRDNGILIEFRPLKGNALVSALSIAPLDPH